MYVYTLIKPQTKTSMWLAYGEYYQRTRTDLWDSGFKELRSDDKPPTPSSPLLGAHLDNHVTQRSKVRRAGTCVWLAGGVSGWENGQRMENKTDEWTDRGV